MLSTAGASLQQAGAASLRISGFRDAPSFYADGQRTVAEIRNSMLTEYGVDLTVSGLDAYFDCFAAAKVMVIALKRAGASPSRQKIQQALESMSKVDIGGLEVSFSPTDHTGLEFVDLSIIGQDGKFRR